MKKRRTGRGARSSGLVTLQESAREKPPSYLRAVQAAKSERPAQQRNGAAVSGNGNGQRANSNNDAKGFLVTNHGQLLLQSLAAAVDVATATERYAAASGVELHFTSEDLREIGLRIYATGLK